jgi:hypothetical protein
MGVACAWVTEIMTHQEIKKRVAKLRKKLGKLRRQAEKAVHWDRRDEVARRLAETETQFKAAKLELARALAFKRLSSKKRKARS